MSKSRGKGREGKKYRPRKVLSNPVGYVLEGFGRLVDRDGGGVHAKTVGLYEVAWGKFRRGEGDVSGLGVMCCVWNLTKVLCDVMGIRVEGFDLEGCRGVVSGVLGRYRRWGKVQLVGGELGVLEGLLEVHRLQLDSCTVLEVEDAVREVFRLGVGELELV